MFRTYVRNLIPPNNNKNVTIIKKPNIKHHKSPATSRPNKTTPLNNKEKEAHMPSIELMLAYANSKHHAVKYSMKYPARLGPSHLDCSSFVYYALIAGGFLPQGTAIGNTETLYKLKDTILTEIYSYDSIRPGDIFIRGIEGASGGAAGHTGIFTRKGEIIHCNALNGTVTINNEKSFLRYFLDCERSHKERYFRPTSPAESPTHQQGLATVKATTNVRTSPSTTAKIISVYQPGQLIHYDRLIEANGYKWLSYIAHQSGKRRYVAYSDYKTQWIDI